MPNVMTGKIYENITHEFSDVYPYQVGDYCCHDGYLYRCATATTGAWDISKWIKTRVTDELGGGGAVESVNGKTGAVVLYGSDIKENSSSTSTINDALRNITEDLFAPLFYDTIPYDRNTVVLKKIGYNCFLYRAKTDLVAGAWNPDNWELMYGIYGTEKELSKLATALGLYYDVVSDSYLWSKYPTITAASELVEQSRNLAEEYGAGPASYAVGDYCVYGGKLLQCITAIPDSSVAFDASKWAEIFLTDKLGGGSTVWDPVAATYDETATYGRGNHAIYDNKLYECKVDGTTGTFNAANWYQRKVRDELDDKYTFVIRSNEDLAAFLTNDTTYGNNYKNVGFAYGTYSYNGDVANYGSASNYRTIHGNNATVSITYTATSGSEVSAWMKYTTWYDINLTLNFGLEFAPATDTTFTYFDNSKFDNCNITFSANAFSYYRSTKALSAFTNCTGMTNCNIDSVIASMDSCTCSSFSFMTAVANSVITNNIFSIGSSCTSSWTKTFILMTCNKDNIIFANNYISTKSGSKFYTFTGFSGYGQLENNTFNFNNIHCFGNFTGAQLTSCTGSGNVIKAALGADTTTSITSIGLYAIGPGSYKNFTVELSAPNQKIQAVCIASDKANLSNCKISCSSVSTTSTNIYGIFSQNYCGKLSDNEIGVTGVMNVYGIYVGNVLSNMPIERNHIVLMDTANTSTVTTTSTNLYGIKNNSTRFATIKDNVISCHIQTRNDSSGNLRTYGVIKGIVLDTSTLYARIFNNSLFIPSKAAADPAWTSYTPTAIEAGTNSSAKSAQVHGNIISIYGNTSGDTMTDKGWGTNPIVASGTGSDTSGNYIYNNYD